MASEIKTLIYKLLALISLGAALALGLITLHFYLAQAEIIITANQVPINIEAEISMPITSEEEIATLTSLSEVTNNQNQALKSTSEIEQLRKLVLGIKPPSPTLKETMNDPGDWQMTLKTIPITINHSITPQGESKPVNDYASGLVTIFNEMSFNQSLVASTRLLTPEGLVFRTQERVIVPAQGNIDVEVKADQSGEQGNIAPMSFTIPGLSPARQKLVYAQSYQDLAGGVIMVNTLSEDDFTRASKEADTILREKALADFNQQSPAVTLPHIFLTEVKFNTADKPGEQKNKLQFTASALAHALLFNQETLLALSKGLLNQKIPKDQTILAYNEDSFTYEITNVDEIKRQGTIKIYLEGFATLKDGNSLIDPRFLVGLKADDIQARLLKNTAVQEVQVKFSPFWVSRTPRITNKIHITIKI